MQVERPFFLQSNLLLRAGSSVSSDQVTQGFAQSGLRNSEDGDGTASAGNLFLNSRKFKRISLPTCVGRHESVSGSVPDNFGKK